MNFQLKKCINKLKSKKKALDLNTAPDYTKIKISKDVKMKMFDEYGLPLDGYDYNQHIVNDGE